MGPRRHSPSSSRGGGQGSVSSSSGGRQGGGRGRGRDSSSSGVVYTIRVAGLQRVELDMRESSGLADRYRQFLYNLIQLFSAGGTRVYGIPCCNDDVDDPFLLVIIKITLGGDESSHQFLVHKGTLYLLAFTVLGGENWRTCSDFKHRVENSLSAKFSCQYGQMSSSRGQQSTTHRIVVPYTETRVGPGVVLEALSGLRREQQDGWRSNFKTMCYFIAEACRFTGIRDSIIGLMDAESLQVTGSLTPRLAGIVHHWTLYDCKQHHGEAPLEKDVNWSDFMDEGTRLSTGITSLQMAIDAMGILKIRVETTLEI